MRYVWALGVTILMSAVAHFWAASVAVDKAHAESLGMELPAAAVMRIQIGDFVTNYLWLIALGIFIVLCGAAVIAPTESESSRDNH